MLSDDELTEVEYAATRLHGEHPRIWVTPEFAPLLRRLVDRAPDLVAEVKSRRTAQPSARDGDQHG